MDSKRSINFCKETRVIVIANSFQPPRNGVSVFVTNPDNFAGWGIENVEFSTNDAATVDFVEEDLIPIRGNLVSGDLTSTFASDDDRLVYETGLILSSNEPPVWLQFDATMPCDNPNVLSFSLEARANTPGLRQAIKLFNFEEESYETVDARVASLGDSITVVVIDEDAAEYVETDSGLVHARLNWRVFAPILFSPWEISIDELYWSVTE